MISGIKSELKQHLNPNETLLWVDRPKPGIVFRRDDIFLIPFSLIWFGGAVFWVVSVLRSGPSIFALFGVPFVYIGFRFAFGRFIIDAKQREHMMYGLTEDRIIIQSGGSSKNLKSINTRTMPAIEYEEKADGSGTIYLGNKSSAMMGSNGINWFPGIQASPTLDLIPNVKQVYNQIIQLQNKP